MDERVELFDGSFVDKETFKSLFLELKHRYEQTKELPKGLPYWTTRIQSLKVAIKYPVDPGGLFGRKAKMRQQLESNQKELAAAQAELKRRENEICEAETAYVQLRDKLLPHHYRDDSDVRSFCVIIGSGWASNMKSAMSIYHRVKWETEIQNFGVQERLDLAQYLAERKAKIDSAVAEMARETNALRDKAATNVAQAQQDEKSARSSLNSGWNLIVNQGKSPVGWGD